MRLQSGLGLGLGFPLDVAGVLGSGLPLDAVCGDTSGRFGSLGQSFIEPGCLVITVQLAVKLVASCGLSLRLSLGPALR